MNKKKFLKILEEKLQILSEEERNDILNEYKDTIEEKVRHGSSEEEAVADFGSIEELSREILKAYKINPDYSKNKDKVKELVEDGETLIKKGAEKLSEWTQDAIEDFKNNDQNWTLEMVFEVVIKAIILLIGLSLLRIPFYLIESLGLNIFEMAFPPFDSVFKVILRCFTSLVYLVICIIIAIIVFKPYFVTTKSGSKKKEGKVQETINKKEIEQSVTRKKTGASNVIVEILKAFLFLCTVFPLYFADFGCYIALVVLFFFLIKGVPILGIFLMLLGITIFLTLLTKLFYNLLYGNKRIYCYSLIISAVVFVSGCFFSVGTLADFEVYQGLPDHSFAQKEIIYEETITNDTFHISSHDYEVKEDDMLEDNQIQIIVSYYSDFVRNVDVEEKNIDDTTFYKLKVTHKNVTKAGRKKVYHMVIKELKNLRWYHYSELGKVKIVIKANASTVDKMK